MRNPSRRCMEPKRIKIRTNLKDGRPELFVYADQLSFFSNFSAEEREMDDAMQDFTLKWSLYNAVDAKYLEDETCELVWDDDVGQAYFIFDDQGLVADHLRELKLL